jgi:antitoxin HicB
MTVEDYLALPYRIALVPEPPVDGKPAIWFADVEDLPGCSSQGATPEEAVASVREAMEAWIADALDEGEQVPEPRTDDDYSGKFIVRAPRSLHALLVREAEREGTSLNQFATNALSAAVGWRRAAPEPVELPIEAITLAESPGPYAFTGKTLLIQEVRGTSKS